MSLLPGYERLPRKIRGDRKGPANHLASLHGKVDILPGLITQYDIEFGPEGILHQFGQVITRRGDAVGTALWRRGRAADVVHRFEGSIGAHVQEVVRGDRVADPSEFGPVELHFRFLGKLLEIERRIDGAEGQTIGLGNIVDLVRRDHRRRARNVLYNYIRASGNIFRHKLGEHARIQIIGVAGFGADDDRDGFALEKRRLRLGNGGTED